MKILVFLQKEKCYAVATYIMKTLYLIKPSSKAVVVVLRHIDHKVKDGGFQQFLGTV